MKKIFVKQVRVGSGELHYVIIKTRDIGIGEDTIIGHILTKDELEWYLEAIKSHS